MKDKSVVAWALLALYSVDNVSAVRMTVKSQDDPLFSSLGYTTTHYKDEGKSAYPIDYCVPNDGGDADITDSLANTAEAEKKLKHKWNVLAEAPAPHPINYFVPNLGYDNDVTDSFHSLARVEKDMGKTWIWKKSGRNEYLSNPVPPAQLPENWKYDEDITDTFQHADDAEKTTGLKWKGPY